MEATEQSYRLYSCARCAEQVRICRRCDRGNRYCAGECARTRRCESLRRAGARYQRSHRGACGHAARQRAWRSRRAQKVTHQGSLASRVTGTVTLILTDDTLQAPHDNNPVHEPQSLWRADGSAVVVARCSLCGCALPAFTRFGPVRGGP